MDVTLAGTEVAKDVAASIVVTRVDDSKVKVSLSNFTIPGVLPVPMTIDATCDVVPSTNELKLNGHTIDMSALGMGELAVVITGDADGKELDLDIAVATMKVVVDFEGRKQ